MRRLSITAGKPRPTTTVGEGADLVVHIPTERAAAAAGMHLRLDLVDRADLVGRLEVVDLVGETDRHQEAVIG